MGSLRLKNVFIGPVRLFNNIIGDITNTLNRFNKQQELITQLYTLIGNTKKVDNLLVLIKYEASKISDENYTTIEEALGFCRTQAMYGDSYEEIIFKLISFFKRKNEKLLN